MTMTIPRESRHDLGVSLTSTDLLRLLQLIVLVSISITGAKGCYKQNLQMHSELAANRWDFLVDKHLAAKWMS